MPIPYRQTRPYRQARISALASSLAVLWLIAAAVPARAALLDVFAIDDVPVDATADTVDKARTEAIKAGREVAFRHMLERLTLKADHARLPAFEPERADDFIQGFRVDSEKTSAVRYLGRLTYIFRRAAVRTVLREADIPFAETVSKPVIVLPVFRTDGGARLWADDNPWRDAWNARPTYWGLVPLVIPIGDLSDREDVSAAVALEGDGERLARLTRRNGGGDALVAEATVKDSVLQVVARRYGLTGKGVVVARFTRKLAGDRAAVMAAAIGAIVSGIDERWKRRNLLGFGQESGLVAVVPFSSFGEWRRIRARLGEVAPVRRTDVLSLRRSSRKIELRYIGSLDQLKLAMAQSDLILEEATAAAGPSTNGANWTIRLRAAAEGDEGRDGKETTGPGDTNKGGDAKPALPKDGQEDKDKTGTGD